MLWTINRRIIASLVGFFVGCGAFQLARPAVVRVSTPGADSSSTKPPRREILAITLKRLGCSDAELKCPVYDLTFRNDGTATFVGYKNNDEYDGKSTANFDVLDFALLADQFAAQRFFDLPLPDASAPDDEKVVLEVTTNEGVRTVTTNNWASTPSQLRVLQALVDKQSCQVSWYDAQ
jgi:hypothetical protein